MTVPAFTSTSTSILRGVLGLALLFGFFTLTYRASQIVMGVDARRTQRPLHSVQKDAA